MANDRPRIHILDIPPGVTQDGWQAYVSQLASDAGFARDQVFPDTTLPIDGRSGEARGSAIIYTAPGQEPQVWVEKIRQTPLDGHPLQPYLPRPRQPEQIVPGLKRRRPNDIFVGHLAPITTPAEFRELVAIAARRLSLDIAKIVSRIYYPVHRATGRGKGWAFVSLTDPKHAADFANAIRAQRIHGRFPSAQRAVDPPVTSSRGYNNLAVFNLPNDTTEDDLIRLVEQHAPVISAHLVYDRETGLQKHWKAPKQGSKFVGPLREKLEPATFGFVRLRNPYDSADVISALSGSEYKGRVLRVSTAEADRPVPSRGTFTLDIPGIQDFIRIPALENEALRLQRIARMRTHESTLPQLLQGIPAIINWLDDAQDLLFTALVLAKPLLRRIPARLIPYVGWLMLANDVLNIGTSLLGIPLAGRLPKRRAFANLDFGFFGRASRIARFEKFMAHTSWVGFTIQAAQASRNITEYLLETFTEEGQEAAAAGRKVPGYGLSLGSLMGLSSELIWSPVRILAGDTLAVRAPPPADPLGKALRYLAQSWHWPHMREMLSDDDHKLVTAAHAAAIAIVRDSGHRPPIDGRAGQIEDALAIGWSPWNPASVAALQTDPAWAGGGTQDFFFQSSTDSYNYGPQTPVVGVGLPFWFDQTPGTLGLGNWARYDPDRWRKHAEHMHARTQANPSLAWTAPVALDAARSTFGLYSSDGAEPVSNFTAEEIAILHSVEYNMFPPPDFTQDELRSFLVEAIRRARAGGRRGPNPTDLDGALRSVWGQWRPGTLFPEEITQLFHMEIRDEGVLPPGVVPPDSNP